jgi:hypothetical protein
MIRRLFAALRGKDAGKTTARGNVADDLPPAAHPAVRPDEPKPLDDMPVAPLTDPSETKGG